MMKNQKGAALIVVLSLLTVSLMVGLFSMQSSQIDERLAGNYKASAEAQMGAESAVSEGVHEFFSGTYSAEDFSEGKPEDLVWDDLFSASCEGLVACGYYYLKDGEGGLYVIGFGRVVSNSGEVLSASEMIFAEVLPAGGGSGPGPFSDGLIGCEGVAVTGVETVESRVLTLAPNADIDLGRNTFFDGDVIATGSVQAGGSAGVSGDIRANGNVVIDSDAQYGGSIFSKGNVVLDNSARFLGGVDADGDVVFNNAASVLGGLNSGGNVEFNNTANLAGGLNSAGSVQFNNGARVAGDLNAGGDVAFSHADAYVTGSVTANGDIFNNFDSWKDTDSFSGGGVSHGPAPVIAPVPSVSSSECDVMSLPAVFEEFEMTSNGNVTVGNWPRVNATVTPQKITSFDQTWNVQEDVVLAESVNAPVFGFEGEVPIIRTGDLKLTSGEMRVTGGDVVLYVDGDLALGSGGGPGLVIDPGSTLTIFVTGETNVKSSTQMADVPQITNGRPTFSLFSNKEDFLDSSSSVTIDGNAKATANIYAPFANVRVAAGGGLNGSVRAKRVEVSGGGGVTYDQELSEWETGGGGDGESSVPGIVSWQ